MKNPAYFRGQNQRRRYFEGWYFKCISADRKQALAFIPGMAIDAQGDRHAFLQVIDAVRGKTYKFDYPYEAFAAAKNQLSITVGDNHFGPEGLTVSVSRPRPHPQAWKEGIRYHGTLGGTLKFYQVQTFPTSPLRPSIMGPFAFVPRMECYHAVVHLSHRLSGRIQLDGQTLNFDGGRGYIEKDYGRSFPRTYLWLQASEFEGEDASFVFSRARIPFLGRSFPGFFAYLSDFSGVSACFATYNRARLQTWQVDRHQGRCHGILVGRDGKLEFSAAMQGGGKLRAPVSGAMDRTIQESITAFLELSYHDAQGALRFQAKSDHAGMEMSL